MCVCISVGYLSVCRSVYVSLCVSIGYGSMCRVYICVSVCVCQCGVYECALDVCVSMGHVYVCMCRVYEYVCV